MSLLKTIRKADIRGDWPGVVGCRIEKATWLKAGQVECNDDVSRQGPPNLEISLVAEIARVAGIAWINQGFRFQMHRSCGVRDSQYQTQAKAPVTFCVS